MKGFKSDADDGIQGRICRSVQVSGDVLFSEALYVEGKIIGKLISESGSLIIEQTGDVQSDIDVGICIIRGTVRGNVTCKSRAEIYKTGRVEGNINSPVLLVEEGALLTGAVNMSTKATEQPSAASLPERDRADAEQLRKSKVAS